MIHGLERVRVAVTEGTAAGVDYLALEGLGFSVVTFLAEDDAEIAHRHEGVRVLQAETSHPRVEHLAQ